MARLLWPACILLAAGIFWLIAGRFLIGILDSVSTKRLGPVESQPYRIEGDRLMLGEFTPDFTRPDGQRADIRLDEIAEGELRLLSGGRSFALGRLKDPSDWRGEFIPDAGDQVSVEWRASMIAWPTPFEMNFMTGRTASYRRNVYYRIVWKKASGQTLELVWRFRQGYYPPDGWTSPWGMESGWTGLIRIAIRP